jgi:Ca2+-binding EF-hand superfamily protein
VCEFEYIKFMLVAMRKIDEELFDELRYRFRQLDETGDGKITKGDLVLMAKRRMKKVRNKMMLGEYKVGSMIRQDDVLTGCFKC